MKRAIARALLFSLLWGASVMAAPIKAIGLRVDHEINPTGTSTSPRISWSLESNERLKRQFGFHLLAASSADKLAADTGDLWDQKKENDSRRHLLSWAGKDLKTGQEVHWKVRILDESKAWGEWSAPARFTVHKISPVMRLSSFESNAKHLNTLYQESLAQLEARLKKFAAGEATALGTGGEVQRSARAFFYHFDASASILAYLELLEAGRTEEGYYPSIPGGNTYNSIDANAGVFLPYALWWMAGDAAEAKKRWPIAEKYLMAREKADPKFKGSKWGTEIHCPEGTPQEYLDLCLMGMATRIMRELARPSEEPLDIIRYKDYAARILKSFQSQYLNEDGNLKIKTQTAHLLALRSAVLRREQQATVISSLIESLKAEGIKVGPVGAELLLPVLYLTGNQDLAYELVETKLTPEVKKTLIGNGLTDWMMSSLAGINAQLPGFQQLRIAPQIPTSDTIKWVKAHYESPAGRLAVHWQKEDNGGLTFNCTIPAGVFARLSLPAQKGFTLTESGKTPKDAPGVEPVNRSDTAINLILQSGSYQFSLKK